jgi:hypothetical protein
MPRQLSVTLYHRFERGVPVWKPQGIQCVQIMLYDVFLLLRHRAVIGEWAQWLLIGLRNVVALATRKNTTERQQASHGLHLQNLLSPVQGSEEEFKPFDVA